MCPDLVRADCRRHALRDLLHIAGQHHRAGDAERLQAFDGFLRICFDFVIDDDMSEIDFPLGNVDDRAVVVTVLPCRAAALHELAAADVVVLPVDDRVQAHAGDLLDCCQPGRIEVSAVRTDDRLADRMRRALLCRRRNVKQLIGGAVLRMNCLHRENTVCQRAGLVKDHRIDGCKAFEVVGALDENAAARRPADAAEKAQRDRYDQCAGAGDHQKDAGAAQPVRPRLAEAQRRHQCEQHGADDDSRRIHTRKPRDEAFCLRFLFGGRFHQLENFGDRALGVAAADAHGKQAALVDRAAEHGISLRDGGRDAFAGQCGGLHGRFSGQHDTVQRDALTRPHDDRFPDRDLLRRNREFGSVPQHGGAVRPDVHERGNRAAAPSDGNVLKQLADLEKDHDECRLRIFSDCEGAERGQRHQQGLVKELSVQQISHGIGQHGVSGNQIRHGKERQPPKPADRDQPRGNQQYHGRNDAEQGCFLFGLQPLMRRTERRLLRKKLNLRFQLLCALLHGGEYAVKICVGRFQHQPHLHELHGDRSDALQLCQSALDLCGAVCTVQIFNAETLFHGCTSPPVLSRRSSRCSKPCRMIERTWSSARK